MRPSRRLATILAAAVLGLGGCGSTAVPADRASAVSSTRAHASEDDTLVALATDAGRRFLDRYLASDGRIVRHDHDGDTVSEGQAYGMLVAVAIDDRAAFDSIWRWTREHLQRDDDLLSWRWADGRVADAMPATDADVDAAHALTLASSRFQQPDHARDAVRLAAAIVEHEVIAGSGGPVAVAGPWAVDSRWVNPSYGDPVAFAALAELTGDPTWEALDDAARRVVVGSVTSTDLPPDWAVVTDDAIEPRGAPSGGSPRHGFDAARVAIRFAIDCDPAGRRIAADLADEYAAVDVGDGAPAALIRLSGEPMTDHGHPVMTAAHAAAASASGDRASAFELLSVAERQSAAAPTYYGDAWVALARLWLTTDRLEGCATI